MPLTDLQCHSAECPSGSARARFAEGHGMYPEVLPQWRSLLAPEYRIAGKEKRLALGVHPEVPLAHAPTGTRARTRLPCWPAE